MEGIRQYEQNFYIGGLTVGQVISVLFFFTALAVIAVNQRKGSHGTAA
jgi:hypothetical protein